MKPFGIAQTSFYKPTTVALTDETNAVGAVPYILLHLRILPNPNRQLTEAKESGEEG
jgi:hypothetical protein